jgi:prevent-host-death family protein
MATHTQLTISVGVRELHNRTSELMKAVAEGAELEVTNHGTVVGRMTPAQPDALYERLKRDGMIREPKSVRSKLPPPIKLAPGVTVSDLVKDQQM